MATYSYAGLEVRVTADTRQLTVDIKNSATAAGTDAAHTISDRMSAGLKAVGGLGAAVGKSVATGIAGATTAAVAFGVESFKSAARASEMDAALQALAKANGVTADSLRKVVGSVKDQGIELGVAQDLTAQFVRSQLDLSKASDLARVAQDAAVISGRNSTEVLNDLVHGITTQNTQVLRNAGIQVNATKAQDEYAKTLGKTRGQLTESEKAQATLNAVLTEGGKVAGAYKLAMEEPGKVLRSFKRVTDDIKISVGEGLLQAFGPLILQAYDLAKAVSKVVEPGGALAPIFDAISVSVMKLTAPLLGVIQHWTEWIKNLKPEQIERVTEIIKRFGPAIIAAAGAITLLVAPGLLSQIPVLGGMLTNLLGPAKLVAGGLGSVGQAALHSIPALSGVVPAAGGVGAALGSLALPVTAVVAAIAALMIASSDFRQAVIDLGQALWTGLKPALSSVWELVKTFGLALWEIIRAIGDALGPALSNLAPLLEQIGLLFGANLAGGADGASGSLSAIVPVITGVIKVIGWLLDITTKVLVPIIEVPLKLMVWISTMLQVVNPLKLVGQAIEWLTGVAQKLWHWITGNSPGLIPAFNELGGVAAQVAGAIGGVVAAGFGRAVSAVQSATSSMVDTARGAFSRMTSDAQSAGSSMVEGLKAGLSAAKSMGGWIQGNVTGPVVGFIKSGFGVFSPSTVTITIGGDVIEGLKRGLEAAKKLGGWIQGNVAGPVLDTMRAGLDAAAMTPIGQQMIAGLQEGLAAAQNIGGWIQSNVAGPILGSIKGAFGIGSPSRYTMPMGEDLMAGVEVGMARAADRLTVPDVPGIGSPLLGDFGGLAGLGGGGGATINVYPQAGQDEREIAAQVSRELAWASAGGIR